ncbi:MAG: helix-turn-helix domain-containing protein, partial [Oscillospiraceae bacterium]
MTTEEMGKKLSRYRNIKGMTIKDMSLKSGLSPALISQLERGIGNPTLSVLNALASAMEISLSLLLLEDMKNESMVFRKSDRRRVSLREDGT